MKGIRIGKKQSRLPIIQGGIGIISTADIGFKEPDFKQFPEQANFRSLKKEIAMAREISADGILGMNIMCACANYNEIVREAICNNIDLIISGAGLPLNLPELVNEETTIAPIVSSARALKLLCKKWKKHCNRLPDLIIVEGAEAGGHLGFSFEELANGNKTLEEILAEVILLTKEIGLENNTEIPVIVAGGIYDKNDIEHFLSLGADGVQMATRFVATEECDASHEFKNAYINAEKDDIEIKIDASYLVRILDNLVSNIHKYADRKYAVKIKLSLVNNFICVNFLNIIHSDDGKMLDSNNIGIYSAKNMAEMLDGSLKISVNNNIYNAELKLQILKENNKNFYI